jgi:hypothetical protein
MIRRPLLFATEFLSPKTFFSYQGLSKTFGLINGGVVDPSFLYYLTRPTMYEFGAKTKFNFYQRGNQFSPIERTLLSSVNFNLDKLVATDELAVLNELGRATLKDLKAKVGMVKSLDKVKKGSGGELHFVVTTLDNKKKIIKIPGPIVLDNSSNLFRENTSPTLHDLRPIDMGIHDTNLFNRKRGSLSMAGSSLSVIDLAYQAFMSGRPVLLSDSENGIHKSIKNWTPFLKSTGEHNQQVDFIHSPDFTNMIMERQGLRIISASSVLKDLKWLPNNRILNAQIEQMKAHAEHFGLHLGDVVAYVNDKNKIVYMGEHFNTIGYDQTYVNPLTIDILPQSTSSRLLLGKGLKRDGGNIFMDTQASFTDLGLWMAHPNVIGSGRNLNLASHLITAQHYNTKERISVFEQCLTPLHMHLAMEKDFILWARHNGVTLEAKKLKEVWKAAHELCRTMGSHMSVETLMDKALIKAEIGDPSGSKIRSAVKSTTERVNRNAETLVERLLRDDSSLLYQTVRQHTPRIIQRPDFNF